ncbi:uncharacterized protein LOC121836074 [Ixodes scapularis]|uniref:uncharacterized protein LOC121836074 n=1 Tax=Ixodes scapularis TaxID=6945 RepID=UPI001C389B3B|nr:uncharacterized protein LOC121836074 [Ixodes scapularis]
MARDTRLGMVCVLGVAATVILLGIAATALGSFPLQSAMVVKSPELKNCIAATNLSKCTKGSHYACVMEGGRGQCLPWDGQDICIGGKRARFTSESQCQKACYGDPPLVSTCAAELKVCPCGDHSRKLGWIWTQDSKCASVPTQVCVSEGFRTKRACIATCVPDGKRDRRCSTHRSRECIWPDDALSFFYDPVDETCKFWDAYLCPSSLTTSMEECKKTCA